MGTKKRNMKKVESNIWLPEKVGDSIEGTVIRVNETGLYGVNYDIQNDSGDIITTPSHKGLQGKMQSQGIKVGQYVRIEFQGENPPSVKGQNPTKKYDLYVEE